jgi:hypothetical protein
MGRTDLTSEDGISRFCKGLDTSVETENMSVCATSEPDMGRNENVEVKVGNAGVGEGGSEDPRGLKAALR